MRAAALLLLAAGALAAAPRLEPDTPKGDNTLVGNDTLVRNDTLTGNDTNDDTLSSDLSLAGNATIDDDSEHEPVVRKKRTFGDIVFRGLADVLGYNVARKAPAAAPFPPPLAPVPGIDVPLQAGPAPAPAPPPCGAPRAAGPPPCRPPPPPPPPPKPAPPPCPKPRAVPRPKPRPPPPPPPPPPCAKPRANPATPAPCAPPPPPPPPPKDNLDSITSNLRFSFDFNRNRPTTAPAADEQEEAEQPALVALQPRAARLPVDPAYDPRVYVDAFVVRDGVARRVSTVDAAQYDPQRAADDYLDDEDAPPSYDDYADVQESRDDAVREFGSAVDKFWKQKRPKKVPRPANDYRSVHFGDRELAEQLRRRSDNNVEPSPPRRRTSASQRPQPADDAEEENEPTTTTEDPHRQLRPRVLPPTERNPGQIDTVTVRVPPIYREKRPRKLNRAPDRDDADDTAEADATAETDAGGDNDDEDSDGENSALAPRTEPPRRRRRKKARRTRATPAQDEDFSAGDYDYFGRKLPVSEEEKMFRELRVPEPTRDPDLARLEAQPDGHFLDDHERLREDDERAGDDERLDDSGRADDKGRTHERERLTEDPERAGEEQRADSKERSDQLSPAARVRESGYSANFLRATNVRVDDPRPSRR